MKMTVPWLKRRKACAFQVQRFAELWPKGVEVNSTVTRQAHKEGLDVIWVATHLMSKKQRKEFIVFTLRQSSLVLITLFYDARLLTGRVSWEAAWEAGRAATREAGMNDMWAAAKEAQVEECIKILGLQES